MMCQALRAVAASTILTAVIRVPAADFYVAPDGTPSGAGTEAQPYDLQTALSGSASHPGDTFWLRGGTYAIGHINTQIHGLPDHPISFRQVAGERAQVIGSFTVWGKGGHVVFRD